MNEHLHELITEPHTKTISITKVLAIPAAMVAAFCLIWETLHGRLSDWLFLSYIAVYSGSPIVNNLIAYKFGGKPDVKGAEENVQKVDN